MNDYVQITIPFQTEEQKELAIACLAGIGYEGFEEEGNLLKAFIADPDFSEEALRQELDRQSLVFTRSIIEPTNWNEQWEQGFSPVVVGDFCAVRASFHQPVAGVTHDLVITPKMSFGTGHHATTYMMIEAMSRLDFTGRSVLDFGTGTGVLAILAEKLNAATVIAIDNDSWSIENGQENLEKNGSARVTMQLADNIKGLGKFDIILANINRNIILEHLPQVKDHLVPGGKILFSGLLTSDHDTMQHALQAEGWRIERRDERNGWICLAVISD